MRAPPLLLPLLVIAAPALAQGATPPPPVGPGDRVRVFVTPPPVGDPVGVGAVRSVGPDSLVVRLDGPAGRAPAAFPWADVARVDLAAEDRTGEALGLALGGLGGGLAGYAYGALVGDGSLDTLLAIPASLVGMVVGGVVGSRANGGWRTVYVRR